MHACVGQRLMLEKLSIGARNPLNFQKFPMQLTTMLRILLHQNMACDRGS